MFSFKITSRVVSIWLLSQKRKKAILSFRKKPPNLLLIVWANTLQISFSKIICQIGQIELEKKNECNQWLGKLRVEIKS